MEIVGSVFNLAKAKDAYGDLGAMVENAASKGILYLTAGTALIPQTGCSGSDRMVAQDIINGVNVEYWDLNRNPKEVYIQGIGRVDMVRMIFPGNGASAPKTFDYRITEETVNKSKTLVVTGIGADGKYYFANSGGLDKVYFIQNKPVAEDNIRKAIDHTTSNKQESVPKL